MSVEERAYAEFRAACKRQAKKGREKYGVPLDPADDYDWFKETLEELVDAIMYLTTLQMEKEQLEQENAELRSALSMLRADVGIHPTW